MVCRDRGNGLFWGVGIDCIRTFCPLLTWIPCLLSLAPATIFKFLSSPLWGSSIIWHCIARMREILCTYNIQPPLSNCRVLCLAFLALPWRSIRRGQTLPRHIHTYGVHTHTHTNSRSLGPSLMEPSRPHSLWDAARVASVTYPMGRPRERSFFLWPARICIPYSVQCPRPGTRKLITQL